MTTQQSTSRLRIAYLTQLDPFDKRSWSSGLYYMGQALQRHCGEVTYLGPLRAFTKPTFLSRARAKSSLTLLKRRYLHELGLAAAKQYGREATQKLAGQAFDVIVVGNAGIAIPYLETNIPIVLVNDCVFTHILDYYPYYTHLSRRFIHEISIIEQQAFKKVRASIMSSAWAARSAIQDYHVEPEHVYVVPMGVNLDTIPAREIAAARKPSATCRLLFVGVEWQRKGGDIAYETLLKLEEMGIEAELIICGCVPPMGMTHPRMRVIPFLDKNDERQARQLEQLYVMADFLILPTRADCTPFVLGEANAFGIPVITANTGGVADVVRDGENGYVLPFEARGEAYARVIAELYRDEQRYRQLAQSSRAAFEERLNWDVWGRRVHDILVKECQRPGLAATTTYSQTR
jgi:glycosyltransferase involved in cell wall biosynthesis